MLDSSIDDFDSEKNRRRPEDIAATWFAAARRGIPESGQQPRAKFGWKRRSCFPGHLIAGPGKSPTSYLFARCRLAAPASNLHSPCKQAESPWSDGCILDRPSSRQSQAAPVKKLAALRSEKI